MTVDDRLQAVQWRDLLYQSRLQIRWNVAMPLPWMVASLLLASHGHMIVALPISFIFFLNGLRLVHDAYHHNLGLSRALTHAVMFALSVAMLGSMHAVRYNHLRHHKYCLQDDDVEARSAKMKGWQAIAWGPAFPLLLHLTALRGGSAMQRRFIVGELTAITALVAIAFATGRAFLEYHVIAMAIGQCLTAFFAVWTVHHDCDDSSTMSRTLRNRWKSAIAFNMFFHAEHHLYPKVPTCHLPELAARIDAVAPDFAKQQVY